MIKPHGDSEQGGPRDPSPMGSKRSGTGQHGVPASKKPKLTKAEKYKPPTVEELHSLKGNRNAVSIKLVQATGTCVCILYLFVFPNS